MDADLWLFQSRYGKSRRHRHHPHAFTPLALDARHLPACVARVFLPERPRRLIGRRSRRESGAFDLHGRATRPDVRRRPESRHTGNDSVPGPGALDLSDNPSAVQLYSFTVAPGHHWRLSAEVDSNAWYSALALFSSNGTLLATDNLGLSSSPQDAYLFAGLDAGTYYLGVSGRGNLPNLPAGYDPVSGTPGAVPFTQPGGAYTLSLAIDQADAPVRLLGSSLIYADPASDNPSGLVLAFSGLLNADTLEGDPTPGFYLADQAGQLFPMTAVGLNFSTAQYTFLFDDPLPAGEYTVYVAPKANGGATDLAGYSPVAPGQPAGVLGSFRVAQSWVPTGPNDIGPLWGDMPKGVERNVGLAPGGEESYQFIVENTAPFKIQGLDTSGTVQMRVLDSSGTVEGTAAGTTSLELSLAPGVYHLQIVNTGATSATFTWRLEEVVSWEAVLNNGIGQAPALSFRLVNPTSAGNLPGESWAASNEASTPTSTLIGPVANSGSALGVARDGGTGTGTGFTTSSVAPSGLWLTVGDMLVGRPTAEGGRGLDAVQIGAAEAAANPPGFGQSLVSRSGIQIDSSDDDSPEATADQVEGTANQEPRDGALVASLAPQLPKADDLALVAADWMTRARENLAGWLTPSFGDGPTLEPTDPTAMPIALVRDDSPASDRGDRVHQAQLGPPIAVGLLTIASMRLHQPFRSWLHRHAQSAETNAPRVLRGPHRRSVNARCFLAGRGRALAVMIAEADNWTRSEEAKHLQGR